MLQPLLQEMRAHQRQGSWHVTVRRKATVHEEPGFHALGKELKKGLKDLDVKSNEVTRELRWVRLQY